MRKNVLGFLVCTLAAQFAFELSPAFAAEGRKPIWLAGTVITESGRYVVTRNLSSSGTVPVIEIMAGSVDIDLNGMGLSGGETAPGIRVSNNLFATSIVIRNGTISYTGEGISIPTGAQSVVLEDLRILEASGPAIHLTSTELFTIRRVMVNRAVGGIVIDGVLTKQGTIESCRVRDSDVPILVSSGSLVAVIGNHVDNSIFLGGPGIWLENCRACRVEENTVHDQRTEGLLLRGFSNGKVYNNVVARAGTHGIVLDSTSADSLVRDNVVTESGFHTSVGGDGILVEGDRITIEGNTLNANLGAGLRLAASSSGVTFGRNTARGNTGVGIGPCAASNPLFPPNSCNDGAGNNSSGSNLFPGPPVF